MKSCCIAVACVLMTTSLFAKCARAPIDIQVIVMDKSGGAIESARLQVSWTEHISERNFVGETDPFGKFSTTIQHDTYSAGVGGTDLWYGCQHAVNNIRVSAQKQGYVKAAVTIPLLASKASERITLERNQ